MKINSFATAILLTAGCLHAADLLRNGAFNLPLAPEVRSDFKSDCIKLSQHVEDLTWNKCAKLEITAYDHDAKGNATTFARVFIGGDATTAGFPCRPNTEYAFSVEMRGTAPRTFLGAIEWTEGKGFYDYARIKSTPSGQTTVNPEWTRYQGTFKTGPAAIRAALTIDLWGNAAEKSLPEKPGDYVLIDNASLVEVVSPLAIAATAPAATPRRLTAATFAADAPRLDGRLDEACWSPAQMLDGFKTLGANETPSAATWAKVVATDDALVFAVRCEGAVGPGSRIAENGESVWKDDAIEVFFDPVVSDREFSQFVVAAGGGCWMGFGRGFTPERLGEWQATTRIDDTGWSAEIRIPYRLLGWTTKPNAGASVGFNLCRQRLVGSEYSAWSFPGDSFHERDRFGRLIVGTFSDWLAIERARLERLLSELSPAAQVGVAGERKQLDGLTATADNAANIDVQIRQFEAAIRQARYAGRKFVIAPISATTDPSVPLLPRNLADPPAQIRVRAAVNESAPLFLVLCNVTKRTEEYRITLGRSDWKSGLEGEGNIFPADRIQLRRGVVVKDADSATAERRFDPLVPLDISQTLVVPPGESGLLCLSFDCRDADPGTYRGTLKISPLSEAVPGWKSGQEVKQAGQVESIPFELTILPIVLDPTPKRPLWLMRDALNRAFYDVMEEAGDRIYQFSPYSFFDIKFNNDGSIRTNNFERGLQSLRQHREWRHETGSQGGPLALIGFNSYPELEKHVLRDQFSFGTDAWASAWKNWVKTVDAAMGKAGLEPTDRVMEIWDEPSAKSAEKLISACRLAKEAAPNLQTAVTFQHASHSVDQLEALFPYLDVWCFYSSYLDNADYAGFFKRLRENGKRIWFYDCSTSMRVSLHRYYRLHAWTALLHNLDASGLFWLVDGPNGGYGTQSWDVAANGGLLYRSYDQPIGSIRFECLKLGITDVKYLDKLSEVLKAAKAAGRDDEIVKEAEALLRNGPAKAVRTQSHNSDITDEIRQQVINLILQL